MRTMLLGSLLDVAARNVSRGAQRLALFEAGSVYLLEAPAGESAAEDLGVGEVDPLAGDFPGQRPAPVAEPRRIGGARGRAAGRALLARWRRAGRLLRPQGSARGAGRPARDRARRSSPPRSRSCIPAAAPRSRSAASPPAGSARSIPSSAGPGTSTRRSPSKSISRRCSARPAPARSPTRTSPASPPSTRTSPSSSRPSWRRPSCGGRSSPPAASCCARPTSSTSSKASSSARDARASRCNLEFRAPDRTLTDEEVGAAREAIKAALAEIGGALRE